MSEVSLEGIFVQYLCILNYEWDRMRGCENAWIIEISKAKMKTERITFFCCESTYKPEFNEWIYMNLCKSYEKAQLNPSTYRKSFNSVITMD